MTDKEIAETILVLERDARRLIGAISHRDADGTTDGVAEAETQAALASARVELLEAHREFVREMSSTPDHDA